MPPPNGDQPTLAEMANTLATVQGDVTGVRDTLADVAAIAAENRNLLAELADANDAAKLAAQLDFDAAKKLQLKAVVLHGPSWAMFTKDTKTKLARKGIPGVGRKTTQEQCAAYLALKPRLTKSLETLRGTTIGVQLREVMPKLWGKYATGERKAEANKNLVLKMVKKNNHLRSLVVAILKSAGLPLDKDQAVVMMQGKMGEYIETFATNTCDEYLAGKYVDTEDENAPWKLKPGCSSSGGSAAFVNRPEGDYGSPYATRTRKRGMKAADAAMESDEDDDTTTDADPNV